MENHFLLNRDIDSKHRGKLFSEQKLVPLVTRSSKFDWTIHPQWVRRLKWSGLLPFARLVEATDTSKHTSIDGSLLTCLVDRWRPETHTFHFRWGEMAPTLQDVSMLLGLPLAGNPIGPLADPPEWQTELGARFFNIYADAPVLTSEPHGPKFDWLQKFRIENFPGYPHVQMSDIQITRSLEAYLMWLLGKLCSVSLVAGLLVCLHSAAKITHKTQAITSVAAAWHADATIHAFDNDLEDPDPALPAATGYLAPANAYRVAPGEESDGYGDDDDDDEAMSEGSIDDSKLVLFQVNNMSFQKRQALVNYLENNRAGITVYGFVVDRTWLHALFMIEFSLVMWLLGKTVGIS